MKVRSPKRVLVMLGSLFIALILSMSGCPAPAPEVFTLKFDTFWGPEYHATKQALLPCVEAIEAESNGKIKFELYYAKALVKGAEAYEGVATGVADIAHTSPNYEAGKMPRGDIFALPFSLPMGIANPEIRAEIMWELHEKYTHKDLDPRVKLIGFSTTSEYRFMTAKKKVTSKEDLKGLKLRSSGGFHTDLIKAVEAAPVTMMPGEIYEALERGILDGVYHTYAAQHGWGTYEPLKYSTDLTSAIFPNYWIINLEKFEGLPAELQDIIVRNFKEYMPKITTAYHNDEVDFFPKMGIEEVTLSQAEKERIINAVMPIWETWLENAEKEGIDGKAMIRDLAASWKKHGFTPLAAWVKLAE